MAAALALAFQSTHLDGLTGLFEFLTMIRGVSLIAGEASSAEINPVFSVSQPPTTPPSNTHTDITQPSPVLTHSISPFSLADAAHSLTTLTALSLTPSEQTYLLTLQRTISTAQFSPAHATAPFAALYTLPARWTHTEFRSFVDASNARALILLAHTIAVQVVLGPVLCVRCAGFEGVSAPAAAVGWIGCIWEVLPVGLRGLVEWPRRVANGTGGVSWEGDGWDGDAGIGRGW
jgi:hypothetical protein